MSKKLRMILILSSAIIILFVLFFLFFTEEIWDTLLEKNVRDFLEDTLTGMAYMPVYASETEAEGMTSYKKVVIAASALIARGEAQKQENGGYVVFHEELQSELAGLFWDSFAFDVFADSEYVFRNEYGDVTVMADPRIGKPGYVTEDSFYGLIGSEPTTVRVHYALFDGERDIAGSGYTVTYTLVYDSGSPYGFVVTDMTSYGE